MPPKEQHTESNVLHSEATPLLPQTALAVTASPSIDEELGRHDHVHRKRPSFQREQLPLWRCELNSMIQLALPVVGTYVLEMLPGLVSIVLVGHLRDEQTQAYIDATALAVMYSNLTGMSIGIGLATAMDTLCSQAYGANKTHQMGTYLQTGVLVLGLFSILVGILFYNCRYILIALGQPLVVSELAGIYTLYLLPGIPFLFLYELLRKVLQAQNVVKPMLYVSVAANLVNIALGYYFVYHTSFGWLGAAIARTAGNMAFFLLLLPYTIYTGLAETFWTGLHVRAAIAGISQFLALGIPGMLQLCFEWWAFEVLSLISGILPNALVAIGANAVILNISSMTYMLYLGLSISCNVRVGNALGANDPKRAKVAAQLTLGMAAVVAMGCATFLLVTRKHLPLLFTHDPDINALASQLMVVSAIFQVPDSLNGCIQGIFRGSGRQSLGAKLNFLAYYMLGIPLACFMAFGSFHWGVTGLWVGMTNGLLLIAVVGIYIVTNSDWTHLATEAQARVHNE